MNHSSYLTQNIVVLLTILYDIINDKHNFIYLCLLYYVYKEFTFTTTTTTHFLLVIFEAIFIYILIFSNKVVRLNGNN